MKQQGDVYECLGVPPSADLPEIIQAYRQAMAVLKADAAHLAPEALEQRKLALREAFEILTDPGKRSAYDMSRRQLVDPQAELDALLAEAASSKRRRSPLRTVLTVIAVLLAVGLAIQVSVMFFSYRRGLVQSEVNGTMTPEAQAREDRLVLRQLNMTYGVEAKTRKEAEAMVAEIEARAKRTQQAHQEEFARDQRQRKEKDFAEEARWQAEQISAELREAERQAAQEQAEKKRQMEAEARQHDEALREKVERDAARWRNRVIAE